MNALLGEHYWTIHVTPEDFCSYASFETSVPLGETGQKPLESLLADVVAVFQPDAFSVSLFTHDAAELETYSRMAGLHKHVYASPVLCEYDVQDRVMHGLGACELVYMHFEKKDGKNRQHVSLLKRTC